MPQHVKGHVALLVHLLLAQFLREFARQLVGFEDVALVHLENDLITPLRVVPMEVALF